MKLRIYHLSLDVMSELVKMGFRGYRVIEMRDDSDEISIEIEPSYGDRIEGKYHVSIDFKSVTIRFQFNRGRAYKSFVIYPNEFGTIEFI